MSPSTSFSALFGRGGPSISLLLGVLLLYSAFFPREPTKDQLRSIEGDVQKFTVVNDWYGRAERIEFELRGSSVRYWTDRLPSELTTMPVGGVPVHVATYAQFEGHEPKKTLAGTVKTYGLDVNGREVLSAEDYLAGEKGFRTYIMAPAGTVILATTTGRWLYRRRRSSV